MHIFNYSIIIDLKNFVVKIKVGFLFFFSQLMLTGFVMLDFSGFWAGFLLLLDRFVPEILQRMLWGTQAKPAASIAKCRALSGLATCLFHSILQNFFHFTCAILFVKLAESLNLA